jgi:hypothetical protein
LKQRIIKGGKRYVRNYSRRCRGRITWYRRQLKKNPAQKAVYEKKINSYRFKIRRCRGYWRKPAVRRIQKRTVKRVFKRRPVKTTVRRRIIGRGGVRRVIKKRVPKVVIRRRAVIRYTNKINNLKKQVKTAKGPQKRVIRRRILKNRIIKGGRRYVTKYTRRCRGRIAWYRTQIKKNPAKKAVFIRRINRYNTKIIRCKRIARRPSVRRIRRTQVKRIVRRKAPIRRVVTKPVVKRAVVRKFTRKINNLKKQAKTAKGPQRRVIRRRILKNRIIRGGKRYVTNYTRRCRGRIAWYRTQI